MARMKFYEGFETKREFLPGLPILARMDGRSFHNFTKGLKRPYDERLSNIMVETTRRLVKETNARIGYTQSDEITLLFHTDSKDSQLWFDRKIFKMTSQLGALTTLFFNQQLEMLPSEYYFRNPTFDARVWQVPNKDEAVNTFMCREFDATKNSISMAAEAHYSSQELFGVPTFERLALLESKGITWNEYPTFFKRGTYVQKRVETGKLKEYELEDLPEKHMARTNPNLQITRSHIKAVDMPRLTKVVNKTGVIFDGEVPVIEESKLSSS